MAFFPEVITREVLPTLLLLETVSLSREHLKVSWANAGHF